MSKKAQFLTLQLMAYGVIFITMAAAAATSFDVKEIFVGGYAHAAIDAELEHTEAKNMLRIMAMYSLQEAVNRVQADVAYTQNMPIDPQTTLFIAKEDATRYYPSLRERLDQLEEPFNEAISKHVAVYNKNIITEQAFKTEKIVDIEEGLPYYTLPVEEYQLGYEQEKIIIKPLKQIEIIFARPAGSEEGVETQDTGWNGRYIADSSVNVQANKELKEKIYPFFEWETNVNAAYMCMHYELLESFTFDTIDEKVTFCEEFSGMYILFDKINRLTIDDNKFSARQNIICGKDDVKEQEYALAKESWTLAHNQAENMVFSSPAIVFENKNSNEKIVFAFRKERGQPTRWMYTLDGNNWQRIQLYSGADDEREQLRELMSSETWDEGSQNIVTMITLVIESTAKPYNEYSVKVNQKSISAPVTVSELQTIIRTENFIDALEQYSAVVDNKRAKEETIHSIFEQIPGCDVFYPELQQPEKVVTIVGQTIVEQYFTDIISLTGEKPTVAEQFRIFEQDEFKELDFYTIYDGYKKIENVLSSRQKEWLESSTNREVLYDEFPFQNIQADLNDNQKLEYWEAVYGLSELPVSDWNIALQLLQ